MPKAEILTIGTELLLGEILDSNAQYIALQLRDAGIDLYWISTVGDNQERIAQAVQLALTRSDILICTGGLGPTIDDMTREAIAQAVNRDLEYYEELWQKIRERFARFGREPSKNNKRQAFIPVGAIPIDNPVGSAPGLIVEQNEKVIIALPGVPKEMSRLMQDSVLPYLSQKFGNDFVIRSRILHTAGVGESIIDEKIADLEESANPTLGMAAHAGAVDLRLTAKNKSLAEAESSLDNLEAKIRERLGDWIYGVDEQTLVSVIKAQLVAQNWQISLLEFGLGQKLVDISSEFAETLAGADILPGSPSKEELAAKAQEYAEDTKADIVLLASLLADEPQSQLLIAVYLHGQTREFSYPFGGASDLAPEWAVNLALSLLLKMLNNAVSQR
jgi:competence/damage-inducible protein CinA-like protein